MKKNDKSMPRRQFISLSATTLGAIGAMSQAELPAVAATSDKSKKATAPDANHHFSSLYSGQNLNRIAFPMGGLGAGMICLEGTGALSHFSLRNKPEVFNEPCTFAALCIKGSPNVARVLEGPVPGWKLFGAPGAGNGAAGSSFGLPRFRKATFSTRFPFSTVALEDPQIPVSVKLTGWSPFIPGDANNCSLPAVAIEYHFENKSSKAVEAVFSFNAKNFMAVQGAGQGIRSCQGGFTLWSAAPANRAWEEGSFSAFVTDPEVKVNHAWFRGGWWDGLTLAWKDVAEGTCNSRPPVTEGGNPPGASLFVPFNLPPKGSKTIVLHLCWYVSQTNLRFGKDSNEEGSKVEGNFRPWYAGRFGNVSEISQYWTSYYAELKQKSQLFSDCFYQSTLPPEVIEAVAANLTILKSPTVLRQTDGKLWAWEGCSDNSGCCHGSCTHVWNYAQAICHLFPELERSLRETEFGPSQDSKGHQQFRSALPIRPLQHDFHAAADGQLGGIMKLHRDWRISGDTEWLKKLWPKAKASLNYCIQTWDPAHKGWLEEPHHNTYDIEFWGPDGMCTSFYLGALNAAMLMGKALGDEVPLYAELYDKGIQKIEKDLYDGEYFIQKIEWKNLQAKPLEMKSMVGDYSPEAKALFDKEGPKYQYGSGCLSDGVLGSWLAAVCGVGQVIDSAKITSHLKSVHKYNLKRDLTAHSNPQRPSYACGSEGGLLLCSWPKGGQLSLPFVYSDEVWTGIEYQVASHLMLMGCIKEGLEIVQFCRNRYDGRTRNPFNEYECGHWYARAMSSYGLLQGLTGARYDRVEKVLYLHPSIKGDFQSFISTATGFGLVGVKNGKPFCEAKSGTIEISRIDYVAKA